MTLDIAKISQKQEMRVLCDLKKIGVESAELIGKYSKRYRAYYSASLFDRKIFIKLATQPLFRKNRTFNHETEFALCNRLHTINPKNFPETIFLLKGKRYTCLAYEFLEGESFKRMECHNLPLHQKENFIVQLKRIAENLWESGIVHQDIHSGNLIALKDGTLKLIDFDYSYDFEDPPWMKRYSILRKCPPLFQLLVRQKHMYENSLDDYSSMLKILERIGFHESYQKNYCDLESFLKQRVGKRLFVAAQYRAMIFVNKFRGWLK